MALAELFPRRLPAMTDLGRKRAACGKNAGGIGPGMVGRNDGRRGHAALNFHQTLSFRTARRHGLEQEPRIGVGRFAEDFFHGAFLDHRSSIIDEHTVAEFTDDTNIVRDKEHAQALLIAKAAQQVEKFFLHRKIQGRRGFVRHENFRMIDQGHGAEHALALSSRELMGKSPGNLLGGVKLDAAKHLQDTGFSLPGRKFGMMNQETFTDLDTDALQRIQGLLSILKNHGDFPPPKGLPAAFGGPLQRFSSQRDLTLPGGRLRQQVQQRQSGNRFAAARFAAEAEDFALVKLEVNILQNAPVVRGKAYPEIIDGEQTHRAPPLSSSSCWPLRARRKIAKTVRTIARPGKRASQGA